MGGLVRYVADRWGANRIRPGQSETESDSSPGVLCATGYIAGGAIAGVIIGFLSFGDALPRYLAQWQFQREVITEAQSLEKSAEVLARQELKLTGKTEQELSATEANELTQAAKEIEELNEPLLIQHVKVAKGTKLVLPKKDSMDVEQDTTLGDLARAKFGNADKAQLLYDDNKDSLKLPEQLPAGVALKVPQGNNMALAAFGVLTLFLVLVSVGWILRTGGG